MTSDDGGLLQTQIQDWIAQLEGERDQLLAVAEAIQQIIQAYLSAIQDARRRARERQALIELLRDLLNRL